MKHSMSDDDVHLYVPVMIANGFDPHDMTTDQVQDLENLLEFVYALGMSHECNNDCEVD